MQVPPTDPLFADQWQFQNTANSDFDLNILPVWGDYTGQGVTLAVNDVGVQLDQADLAANIDVARSYDLVLGQWGINDLGPDDTHGTMVASCAGAVADNGVGGVGAAPEVTLIGLRNDSESTEMRAEGVSIARMADADIVNNSWGPSHLGDFASLSTAIADHWADFGLNGRVGLGGINVLAAGNSRGQTLQADYSPTHTSPYGVVIGAVRADGPAFLIQSSGPNLLAVAPGVDLATTTIDAVETTVATGTSFAAPLAAGVTALMLEANPGLGARDVTEILAYSARYHDEMVDQLASEELARGAAFFGSQRIDDTTAARLGFTKPATIEDVPHDLVEKFHGGADWITNGAGNWNGGGLHFSPDFGFGLIDARAAVRLAESWDTPAATYRDMVTLSQTDTSATALTGPGQPVSTVSRSFTFDQAVTVEQARLGVTLPGGVADDVTITLTAPSGTTSQLFGDYSTAFDYGNADAEILADLLTARGHGATFGLSAEIDLASRAFFGESAAGTWTVTIAYQDQDPWPVAPVLDQVRLDLFGAAADADDRYIYSDAYADHADDDDRSVLADADGGNDTLNGAMLGGDAVIDLTPGATSTLAGRALTLDAGTVIENAWSGDGNDLLTGQEAANGLNGGRGFDTLSGGAGDDTLAGGRHDDLLTGGADADVFRFGASNGRDVVTDYADGVDRLEIATATGTAGFDSLARAQVGADTVLTLGDGGQVVLAGLALGQLDAGDIIFV